MHSLAVTSVAVTANAALFCCIAAAGHIKGLPIHTPQEVQQPMSPPAPSPDGNVLQEVPVPNLMGDFGEGPRLNAALKNAAHEN